MSNSQLHIDQLKVQWRVLRARKNNGLLNVSVEMMQITEKLAEEGYHLNVDGTDWIPDEPEKWQGKDET